MYLYLVKKFAEITQNYYILGEIILKFNKIKGLLASVLAVSSILISGMSGSFVPVGAAPAVLAAHSNDTGKSNVGTYYSLGGSSYGVSYAPPRQDGVTNLPINIRYYYQNQTEQWVTEVYVTNDANNLQGKHWVGVSKQNSAPVVKDFENIYKYWKNYKDNNNKILRHYGMSGDARLVVGSIQINEFLQGSGKLAKYDNYNNLVLEPGVFNPILNTQYKLGQNGALGIRYSYDGKTNPINVRYRLSKSRGEWITEIYVKNFQNSKQWVEIPGISNGNDLKNICQNIYQDFRGTWGRIGQKYDTSNLHGFVSEDVNSNEFFVETLPVPLKAQHQAPRQLNPAAAVQPVVICRQVQNSTAVQQHFLQAMCCGPVAPPQVTKTVYGPNGTQYTTIKILGSGSFGTCYEAIDSWGRTVCLKEMNYNGDQNILMEFEKESTALRLVQQIAGNRNRGNKESLPGFYGGFIYGDKCYIAMEKINGPDLEKLIVDANNPSIRNELTLRTKDDLKRILGLLANVACDVSWLHSKGLMHRDLKPQNIMYNRDKNCFSLIDFGISKILDRNGLANTSIGTPFYMAPEIWRHEPYSYGTDVWALGLVVLDALGIRNPFGDDQISFFSNIRNHRFQLDVVGTLNCKLSRLIPQNQMNDLTNLIMQALNKNSCRRPNMVKFSQELARIAQSL
jgi:hypothetical protein